MEDEISIWNCLRLKSVFGLIRQKLDTLNNVILKSTPVWFWNYRLIDLSWLQTGLAYPNLKSKMSCIHIFLAKKRKRLFGKVNTLLILTYKIFKL